MNSFFSKSAKRRPHKPVGDRTASNEASQYHVSTPGGKRRHAVAADGERVRSDEKGNRKMQANDDADVPLLPGIKPVLELLETSPERIDTVFLRKGRHSRDMDRIADACRAAGVRFSLLDPPLFSRIYAGTSQGVVARLFEAGYVELEKLLAGVMDAPLPLILAFDQLQDPGNAGTLARTLYALGGAGIITTRHNGAYLGAAAAKASAGALERLPVCKAANLGQALDKAAKEGIVIYGAAGQTRADENAKARERYLDVYGFTPRLPAILVLGSEESGMRAGMEKRCDFFLSIPMVRDFDSLNVAQAGAIIISCFSRAMRK